MTRSLLDRCHEVMDFLNEKKAERLFYARKLLESKGKNRLVHAISFLQTELNMHREVRTLWPYLLAIPESEETQLFVDLYQCNIDDLGPTVDKRINEMTRLLDVIESKLQKTFPPGSFWLSIRDELLAKICQEAKKVLEE